MKGRAFSQKRKKSGVFLKFKGTTTQKMGPKRIKMGNEEAFTMRTEPFTNYSHDD
jgi:hypothetical protein